MDRSCRIVVLLLATVVVSVCVAPTSSTSPPPATATVSNCLKNCVCKWKGGKESVTCHQSAGLTEIPSLGGGGQGEAVTVQWLDLSGNAIGQLGAEQFRKVGLVHLQRIVLQRCSLRTIERTALSGLTNLIELDLSHNVLTSIPSGALQYATELRELKLNGNSILRLSDSVLVSGTKLIRLELANCQISQIDHKAFQGLEMLEWLRLDGNLIDTLSTSSLGPMRSLRGIDLHHNPWNCSCQLRPLRLWLAARNMPFSVPPLCLHPSRLRGQSWSRISLDELACPPHLKAVQSLVQSVAGQPATLVCNIQSNPESDIMWFFADRLIANLSSSPSDSSSSSAIHQVFYVREIGERTDRTSELVLASAREQDSGVYVCAATNRAERAMVNVTLLVKPNPNEMGGLGRGLTAGLILAFFAVLVICLLVCCLCSLKRARLHSSLGNRRPSTVMGVMGNGGGAVRRNSSLPNGSSGIDPLFYLRTQSNGGSGVHLKRQMSGESLDFESRGSQTNILTDPGEKQWLVSRRESADYPPVDVESGGGHRQIALYSSQQNKVSFNRRKSNEMMADNTPVSGGGGGGTTRRSSSQLSEMMSPSPPPPPSSVSSSSAMPRRSYPDLIEGSIIADDDQDDDDDDVELVVDQELLSPSSPTAISASQLELNERPQQRRRRSLVTVLPPARYLPYRPSRRRLSDWQLSQLEQSQSQQYYDDYYEDYAGGGGGGGDEYDLMMMAAAAEEEPMSPVSTSVAMMRRHSIDDFVSGGVGDDDMSFHRRYAYHTDQLNRFLFEYRALQKRLARMQTTWNQCLDGPTPPTVVMANPLIASGGGRTRRIQPAKPMPLRPILKNRHQPGPQQQKNRRWAQQPQEEDNEEIEQQSVNGGGGRRRSNCDVVDEQYFS